MSFKTPQEKFKCEDCHAYFIEESEKYCDKCAKKHNTDRDGEPLE